MMQYDHTTMMRVLAFDWLPRGTMGNERQQPVHAVSNNQRQRL
jgi:hypothetical protein